MEANPRTLNAETARDNGHQLRHMVDEIDA